MKNELWDAWSSCHDDPEQQKRIASAKKSALTPVHIDRDELTGTFVGSSGHHNTTLNYCSCIDFNRRKLPCKHMYRLAMELGCFESDFSSDAKCIVQPGQNSSFKKEIMESILSALTTDDERYAFKNFCYSVKNTSKGELLPTPIAKKLIDIEIVVPVTDMETLLSHMKMPDLRKLLPPGSKGFRYKKDLIAYLLPIVTADDVQFGDNLCVSLHPRVVSLGNTIHRRLCDVLPKDDRAAYWSF